MVCSLFCSFCKGLASSAKCVSQVLRECFGCPLKGKVACLVLQQKYSQDGQMFIYNQRCHSNGVPEELSHVFPCRVYCPFVWMFLVVFKAALLLQKRNRVSNCQLHFEDLGQPQSAGHVECQRGGSLIICSSAFEHLASQHWTRPNKLP